MLILCLTFLFFRLCWNTGISFTGGAQKGTLWQTCGYLGLWYVLEVNSLTRLKLKCEDIFFISEISPILFSFITCKIGFWLFLLNFSSFHFQGSFCTFYWLATHHFGMRTNIDCTHRSKLEHMTLVLLSDLVYYCLIFEIT